MSELILKKIIKYQIIFTLALLLSFAVYVILVLKAAYYAKEYAERECLQCPEPALNEILKNGETIIWQAK